MADVIFRPQTRRCELGNASILRSNAADCYLDFLYISAYSKPRENALYHHLTIFVALHTRNRLVSAPRIGLGYVSGSCFFNKLEVSTSNAHHIIHRLLLSRINSAFFNVSFNYVLPTFCCSRIVQQALEDNTYVIYRRVRFN